ncbi:aminoglycoside phosphotransferase family protein [Morganella morganii]|uniref:aminoglycoside phosphotransferase family protein n=2 Tax=Morganella morganii TaxID=582 RepID=UPI0009B7F21B
MPECIPVSHFDCKDVKGNFMDTFKLKLWLIGERGFDFANIFTNPDLGNPVPPVATVPETFKQRLSIITRMAELDRERLLKWIIAWCGLSTAWCRKTIMFETFLHSQSVLSCQ